MTGDIDDHGEKITLKTTTVEKKIINTDIWVIVLLGCAFFSAVSVNYVISPILPEIAESFQISVSTAASLVSIYGAVYGCSAVLFGPIADFLPRKKMMNISLLSFSVAILLCGLSQSFIVLKLFRAFSALAAAAMQPVTWAYLADYFPYNKRGTASGWVMQAGSMALLLGVPIGGIVTQFLSWRVLIITQSIFPLIVIVLINLKLPDVERHSKRCFTYREIAYQTKNLVFKDLFTNKTVLVTYLVSFLIWTSFFSSYTFLGTFLKDTYNMKSATVGITSICLGIGYVVGGQVSGRVSDKIGRKKVILMGLFFLTPVLGMLFFTKNIYLTALLIFFAGCGYFFSYTPQVTFVTELVPKARSSVVSVNYFVTYLGLTFGSAIASLLYKNFGLKYISLFSATICIIATLVMLKNKMELPMKT